MIFADYRNKYFVETGTCGGAGVQAALNCGFKEIRSIELSEELYKYSRKLFKIYPHVKLYHGDSTLKLGEMIADITEPITFFLDGHYSGGTTAWNENHIPELITELQYIAQHPIKTHTILIDDYRDYKILNLEKIISQINPLYKFTFGTYHDTFPNDVLIATV